MTTQPAEIPELSEALAAKILLDLLRCRAAFVEDAEFTSGVVFCFGVFRYPMDCEYSAIVGSIGLDRCRELIADSSRKGEANGV